jgi:hypothetical protein
MMAVGKTHMCEGIAHGLKEIARFKKDITREASRVTDQTALSALETHLESLTDLETNYASYIEWDNEFGDPMYPLFEAMDKIRFAIEEIVFAQHDTMEHDNACGAFPEIKAHMSSSAASNVPADLATKVAKLVAKGEKACAEGEIKVAFDVLDFMERKIRPEIERYMDISEGGREDDFNFGVDKDEILQEAFTANIGDTEGVDIAALVAKIEKKMLSKMQKAVEAAVDAVTQKFMAKIAVMESKFAEAISDKMAAVMDNVTVGFQGVLKDKIMNTKVGLSEVQGELDNVVANVDLTTETENNYEELLEYATVRNFSSTAADQVQKQIGAVTNALSLASDETEAKTTATEEIATALENVKAIYKADKTTQLEEGILPFGDLHGGEEKWYAGYAAAAKGAGIVKGETDEEGVANMNADKATNIAEGLTMLARTAAGGADNITTAIDTSNPVVNRLPEWAQAPASYLANERGMDLEAILGGKIADDSMTRGEMMHAASQAFSLQAEDESGTLGAFNDQESISSAQKAGVAALVEAGVVSGEGTTGNVNTEGELNRAAFAKIMIEAEKVAETE